MHVISTSSGKQFSVHANESLLDAALRQGLAFEYSCKTGRCSTCKGKVVTGSTLAAHEEIGLTAAEKAAGWVLTCVRQALSDTTLAIDDLGDVRLFPAKTLPCRIHTLDRLAPDVMRVQLRLPPASSFDYRPGQYIDVIGPGGIRRSYSVANAPAADKLIELHVREVPGGGMSRYWFGEAKQNDLLRLNGPLGTFFLRDIAGKDLVFLATGTGIAPVKAMLESLDRVDAERLPRSIAVYWGGRQRADLYWRPTGISADHRFEPVLSQAPSDWTGRKGHVQSVLLSDAPSLADSVVYACGSDAMIHSARELLQSEGLPARAFHSDAFVCSASA